MFDQFFEILSKAFGVVTLCRVIHLFVDRLVELTQHARPIGVLIELRKAFGEVCDFVEDLEIALDRRLEIRPLHFYGNLFPAMQTCPIHLTERCCRDRF